MLNFDFVPDFRNGGLSSYKCLTKIRLHVGGGFLLFVYCLLWVEVVGRIIAVSPALM